MLRISEVFLSENRLFFRIIIGCKRYHVMLHGAIKIIDDFHSLIIRSIVDNNDFYMGIRLL